MKTTYDIHQPRLTISQNSLPGEFTHDHKNDREIGQAEAYGEAYFFLSIGYKLNVSRFNPGKGIYETSENIFPEDI